MTSNWHAALELLIVIPGTAAAGRIDATWPASPPPPSILMALVIVTVPNPPGSSASISPQSAVLEIAPGKGLAGCGAAARIDVVADPDTQVRVACADACDVSAQKQMANAARTK